MTEQNILPPPKPGEVLRKLLLSDTPSEGRITQDQLAAAMGVSRVSVNQLVMGHRGITAEMALRLAKATATTPEFWLNLQQRSDLHEARLRLRTELDEIPSLRRPVPDDQLFHDV